jgi:hypothetical protein
MVLSSSTSVVKRWTFVLFYLVETIPDGIYAGTYPLALCSHGQMHHIAVVRSEEDLSVVEKPKTHPS